jgi:hypothetical protein
MRLFGLLAFAVGVIALVVVLDSQQQASGDTFIDPYGVYHVRVNILNDPGGHAEFIDMPSNITLTVRPSSLVDEMIGPPPWVRVTDDLDKSSLGGWDLEMSGTGTVAGHENVDVRLTGNISEGMLTGIYAMGTDGGLPGGQAIEYQLKAKATPILVTPFTATATPPAGTPTATLPAGTPTATATLPSNLPQARSWQVNIEVSDNPNNLEAKVDMPAGRILLGTMLVQSGNDWVFTLASTDGESWLDVEGGPGADAGTMTQHANGSWSMELQGSGSIGDNEFEATFEGTLSADSGTLTGVYTLYGDAGTISYDIASKPPPTATVCPPASSGQVQCPAATATPTGQPQPFTPTATRTPTSGVTPIPPTPTWTRTPACTPGPGGAGGEVCPGSGDANKDGTVNAIDAALVLQHTAALFSLGKRSANADVDQDGDITSIDASLILQYGAGLIDALPRTG